jgi:hypothetical protein
MGFDDSESSKEMIVLTLASGGNARDCLMPRANHKQESIMADLLLLHVSSDAISTWHLIVFFFLSLGEGHHSIIRI